MLFRSDSQPFLFVDLSGPPALWPPQGEPSPMRKNPEVLSGGKRSHPFDITLVRNQVALLRLGELYAAALNVLLLPSHCERQREQENYDRDGPRCVHVDLPV